MTANQANVLDAYKHYIERAWIADKAEQSYLLELSRFAREASADEVIAMTKELGALRYRHDKARSWHRASVSIGGGLGMRESAS